MVNHNYPRGPVGRESSRVVSWGISAESFVAPEPQSGVCTAVVVLLGSDLVGLIGVEVTAMVSLELSRAGSSEM